VTNQQLELLELEPGVSNLEVAAEGEREVLPATPDKKKRKHPGRQTLPANLPRVERVIACTSEQCVRWLRAIDSGDRLRRERAVGC
jgi:transposase